MMINNMLDQKGYRPNVGIILCKDYRHVFWGRRSGQDGWQFPQGGLQIDESPEQAMYRELEEEVGLRRQHVQLIGRTTDWLHYDIPANFRRREDQSRFRGQKQIWYLLRFLGCNDDVCLDKYHQPEFDDWRWVEYWQPLEDIVEFKREVYQLALTELEPLLLNDVQK